MPNKPKRSALTVDQQNHQRSRMMQSASKIISQLDEYVRQGYITVAGKQHSIDTTRLQAYRMILDRTVPTMSSAEITHKSEYEGMDTGKIIERLAQIASKKPELAVQLQEALGGRVISGEIVATHGEVEAGNQPRDDEHCNELPLHYDNPQTGRSCPSQTPTDLSVHKPTDA